ncbi:MAG: prefoldin subunit alpha [Candidatus Bathyarchaeota archaeon]|nr:prefoldin subunit alpha [Candidatus Bathyarchaeota archaeon]
MASKVEEELRRLSIEIRFLEETAQALQSRMNMVNAVIQDLTYANMTLESLGKNELGSELLVPIGGNSYIKAKLDDPDKVIVGMGAGISVEKTSQEAKGIVKKRLEGLGKTRESLQQRFAQVAQKINEDRGKFEELAAELRKGKPSRNV